MLRISGMTMFLRMTVSVSLGVTVFVGVTVFAGMRVLLQALVKSLSCLVKRALLRMPRVGSLSTHEVDR